MHSSSFLQKYHSLISVQCSRAPDSPVYSEHHIHSEVRPGTAAVFHLARSTLAPLLILGHARTLQALTYTGVLSTDIQTQPSCRQMQVASGAPSRAQPLVPLLLVLAQLCALHELLAVQELAPAALVGFQLIIHTLGARLEAVPVGAGPVQDVDLLGCLGQVQGFIQALGALLGCLSLLLPGLGRGASFCLLA